MLDIFSHYVVGWMLAMRESASLAERLLADSIRKQGAERDQLTIHADRGERYLGEQRCDHCNRFCRVAGLGGCRPGCDGPVLLTELLGGLAEAQQ